MNSYCSPVIVREHNVPHGLDKSFALKLMSHDQLEKEHSVPRER